MATNSDIKFGMLSFTDNKFQIRCATPVGTTAWVSAAEILLLSGKDNVAEVSSAKYVGYQNEKSK